MDTFVIEIIYNFMIISKSHKQAYTYTGLSYKKTV